MLLTNKVNGHYLNRTPLFVYFRYFKFDTWHSFIYQMNISPQSERIFLSFMWFQTCMTFLILCNTKIMLKVNEDGCCQARNSTIK